MGDPVTAVLIPGLLGGVLVALLMFLVHRRRSADAVERPFRRDPLSTDVINMSSIKVAGVGGLGLVAMAAAVALNVPRIGQVIAIGLVCGVAIAAFLILRRRKTGSMPSSGRSIGASSVLAIDGCDLAPPAPDGRPPLAPKRLGVAPV